MDIKLPDFQFWHVSTLLRTYRATVYAILPLFWVTTTSFKDFPPMFWLVFHILIEFLIFIFQFCGELRFWFLFCCWPSSYRATTSCNFSMSTTLCVFGKYLTFFWWILLFLSVLSTQKRMFSFGFYY